MEALLKAVQGFMNMGTLILLPLFIMLLGLVFKMNFWKALKAGLLVGVGYEGINVAIGYFCGILAPITAYYSANGSGFTMVDVGWAGIASLGWAMPFAALVVPVVIVLNMLLIKVGFTRTMNVDIWDYWHPLVGGGIVYFITKRLTDSSVLAFVLGFVVAVAFAVLTLKLADKWAPAWQEHFGLDGTTLVNMDACWTIVPLGYAVNWVIDKIPGLNKIDINLDKLSQKLGPLGDSYIISFVVGCILGLLTHNDIKTSIGVGVGVAAGVAFVPKMVSILMEGMAPVSKAAREWSMKHLGKDRDIIVGCDCALGLGDPTGIVTAPIMIPICVLIALVWPNNAWFPMAYMGSLVYTTVLHSMCTKGNAFRTIICTTVMIIWTTITFNFMSGIGTALADFTGAITVADGAVITGSGMNQAQNVILGIIGRLLGAY